MKTLLTTFLFFLFFLTGTLTAQKGTDAKVLEKSSIIIEGTSNVHDWSSEVEQINSNISFHAENLSGEEPVSPVSTLTLTLPVKNIESGKGGMNKRMHGALKADKHPNITFELTSSQMKEGTFTTDKFELMTTGNLTIAGVTKKVTIPVNAVLEDGTTWKFSGSHRINMKEYKVDPPTAMLGAIRSGEMVEIKFDIFVAS